MQAKMLNSDILPVLFNVSAHVGPGKPNRTDDVFLVQFLMKKIGEHYPKYPQTLSTLSVDGRYGPQTAAAIMACQNEWKKKRPTLTVDGVVSPQQGTSPAYGGAVWSICQLNKSVKDKYMNQWPRMQDIPGCPGILKQQCTHQTVGRTSLE